MLNTKQVEKLTKQEWDVNKDGFFIHLYRDEFDDDIWEIYCKNADVHPDIDKLTLLCFGTKINL